MADQTAQVCTDTGRLTSSSFQLSIPMLPGMTSFRELGELKINIFGTIIPTLSLEAIESHWQSNKMLFQSGNLTFEPWEISFVVDSQLKNWRILYDWMTTINNNIDVPGKIPQEYMVNCSLAISDNFKTRLVALMFHNVWIQSLNQIAMSQREGDVILESGATLYYDYFTIDTQGK